MLRKDIVRPLPGGHRHADVQEIAKFDELAEEWWRPDGKFKVVHAFNAARVDYLIDFFAQQSNACTGANSNLPLSGLRLLDAGCGAGIVSLPLAESGAKVTGIDASAQSIAVAQRQAEHLELRVDFRCATPAEIREAEAAFGCGICLEVVEHVGDLEAFIDDLSHLISPGGQLVLGTINRTVQSYLKAIIGAEYILNWLPKRTHDWSKFVKPAELKELLEARGYREIARQGLTFDPLRWQWRLGTDTSVNYLIAFEKQPSMVS